MKRFISTLGLAAAILAMHAAGDVFDDYEILVSCDGPDSAENQPPGAPAPTTMDNEAPASDKPPLPSPPPPKKGYGGHPKPHDKECKSSQPELVGSQPS